LLIQNHLFIYLLTIAGCVGT